MPTEPTTSTARSAHRLRPDRFREWRFSPDGRTLALTRLFNLVHLFPMINSAWRPPPNQYTADDRPTEPWQVAVFAKTFGEVLTWLRFCNAVRGRGKHRLTGRLQLPLKCYCRPPTQARTKRAKNQVLGSGTVLALAGPPSKALNGPRSPRSNVPSPLMSPSHSASSPE